MIKVEQRSHFLRLMSTELFSRKAYKFLKSYQKYKRLRWENADFLFAKSVKQNMFKAKIITFQISENNKNYLRE